MSISKEIEGAHILWYFFSVGFGNLNYFQKIIDINDVHFQRDWGWGLRGVHK